MTELLTMKINKNKTSWDIVCDGFFKKKMQETLLENGIDSESIGKIFENSAKILSNCPNPDSIDKVSKTGIVIGKVQSGKTSNFISLTALAFDNKYDIVVILGGNKKNLLNQTTERIKQYFSNIPKDKIVILSTTENEDILNQSEIQNFISLNRKIIIVALKENRKNIKSVRQIFSNGLLDYPTLVIDDEGDQATPNTKIYQNNESATYRSLMRELRTNIPRHCYISVTATPQANILIDSLDTLSPDFAVLVEPGDAYCGLEEFHGNPDSKNIKIIPDSEMNIFLGGGVPDSFYKALADFFVGYAIRKLRTDNGKHSMLIHPSEKTAIHESLQKKVRLVLEDWKKKAKLKLSGDDDISYDSLKKDLLRSYNCFIKDGLSLPPYDDLENTILEGIRGCSPIHIWNGKNDPSKNADNYNLNIFIGGNMLERGITLSGLAVTYIIRRAKNISNVDNSEQRARWFGYKKKYLDVCRVYMTSDINADFKAIYEHEEDLWETIRREEQRGTSFKDIKRIFILPNNALRLTRSCIQKTERFKYSKWYRQHKIFVDSTASKNCELVNRFKELVKDSTEKFVAKHEITKDLDLMYLKDNLLNHYYFPKSESFDIEIINKLILVLTKYHISRKIDVVWINRENEDSSKRFIYDDNTIAQLFQGRNKQYCGDGYLYIDRPNVMQLQIHKIIPSNKSIDYVNTVLALYIPSEIAEQINSLVTRG